MDTRYERLMPLVLLISLLGLGWLGMRAEVPPVPVGSDAQPEAFSAGRAREHLEEIARDPHPVGSVAHGRLRDYLVASLERLGAETEVQHTMAWSRYSTNYGAEVFNVLGRFPGTDSTGAVLLLAHYDSVVGSYGASDDGAGVAAILETVRALRSSEPLRNDVIVLISDAEEVGLLGATAFVDEHSWFADVSVVLNVEARGSHGAAYMFQTTGPNGTLIRSLASATPRPVANTVMQEVYQRLPNGTDLTLFMGTHVAGMDFAYIRGLSHYHTPLDSLETQDPASLQHHGSYLLGLAGDLGNADLAAPPGSDLTYFNAGSLALVRYPSGWAKPIAIIGLLAALGAIVAGLRVGQMRLGRLPLGLAALGAGIVTAYLIADAGWGWLASNMTSPRWDSYRLFYESGPFVLTFVALTIALVGVALKFGLRWATPAELAALPLVAGGAIGVGLAWAAPGASYLMAWPTLAGAGALWCVAKEEPVEWRDVAVLALLAAPALLLTFPWVVWLEVAMTLSMIGICVVLLGLVLALLTGQVATIIQGSGWSLPVAATVVAAAAWIWGVMSPEYDADRRRPHQVAYAADVSAGAAYWYSADPEVDEWSASWLGDSPERAALPELGFGGRELWVREAEPGLAAATTFDIVSDEITGGRRVLQVRVRVPAGTHRTVLFAPAGAASPIAARSYGRRLEQIDTSPDQARRLATLLGTPAEGFDLELEFDVDAPVALQARTTVPGLPGEVRPHPVGTMGRGVVSIVQTTEEFPWQE
ncbi:MAG: M28 family peptidase [Acidobacteria bacterium]|nr:M28 family peptidase [Acidobacteriota bacterium]